MEQVFKVTMSTQNTRQVLAWLIWKQPASRLTREEAAERQIHDQAQPLLQSRCKQTLIELARCHGRNSTCSRQTPQVH